MIFVEKHGENRRKEIYLVIIIIVNKTTILSTLLKKSILLILTHDIKQGYVNLLPAKMMVFAKAQRKENV